MYCVIYNHTTSDVFDNRTKVYYCKKKALAAKYIEKRTSTLLNKIKKNDQIKNIDIHAGSDYYSISCIEYLPCSIRSIEDTFRIIRGQEILDLDNGPSLKVE